MSERILTTLKVKHRFARNNKGKALKKACFLMSKHSNSLANQTLYEIKQHYKKTWEFVKFWELDKLIRDSKVLDNIWEPYNKNYKGLIANAAQWTVKTIHNEYKSFFSLLKKKNAWKYEAEVNEPHFKKSWWLFKVIYSKKQYWYNKSSHSIKLGLWKKIKEELWLDNNTFITHKLPNFIKYDDIQEVRIQPAWIYFDIEIVYHTDIAELKQGWYLSLDLGINNLASCISNTWDAFIYDWKRLKSYNKFYNKQISKIQTVKEKYWIKGYTNKQKILTYNRRQFINNYFNQIIASLIKYCKANGIATIIVWKNKGWKTWINLWKKNNQTFYAIPFAKLINKLVHKWKIKWIQVLTVEESYTSKCSFLDNEEVKKHKEYKWKRVKRWLFKTVTWKLVNADINGSANILVKALNKLKVSIESKKNILAWVCIGFMNNPVRLRLENNFLFPSLNYETTT